MFQIFVRSTAERGYKTIVLNVHSTDTVIAIKDQLQNHLGVPVHQMRLSFNSKSLHNQSTLGSYNIVNESSLELTLRVIPRCTQITFELKDMKAHMEKFKRSLIDIRKQYNTICNKLCQPLSNCKNITQLFSNWITIKQQIDEEFARNEYAENQIIDNTNEAFIAIKADILRSNDSHRHKTPSNMLLSDNASIKVNLSQRLNDIEELEREFCLNVETECVDVSELLSNKLNEILHDLEMDCDIWTTGHLIEWLKFIEDGQFSDENNDQKMKNIIPYLDVLMHNNRSSNAGNGHNTNNNNGYAKVDVQIEKLKHLNGYLFKTLYDFGICGRNIHEINDSFLRFIGYASSARRLLLKNITCLLAVSDANYNKGRHCLGCMKNIINSVLIPCGHQPYCMVCATANDVAGDRCPICRSNVERVLQTYMAGF